MKKNSNKCNNSICETGLRGFTLLEMLVSLGIFTVVAVIAVGSLVKITDLNRRTQALQSAMNNMNFVTEAMTREMRVGTKYFCDSSDDSSSSFSFNSGYSPSHNTVKNCKAIYFTSANRDPSNSCNLIYGYRAVSGGGNPLSLVKYQQTQCDKKPQPYSILDDSNIKINDIKMTVYKYGGYLMAKMYLTGYAGPMSADGTILYKDQTDFDIETTASQRISD
ncbi:MAG: type II secretion system GspH family protein [Patescibacteria group bacterium]|nr:type II secretion system GspH family protein [Patescibacteria group bacterium]